MKRSFKRYVRKFKAIKEILQADELQRLTKIPTPEVAKALVLSVLQKNYPEPENAHHVRQLHSIADEISKVLEQSHEDIVKKGIRDLTDGYLKNQIWFFITIAGVATFWEFQLRLFAARMGIKLNREPSKKSKKNKNIKAVEYRDLTDIIDDLSEKISPEVGSSLELKRIMEIRNTIVHCNFQQLRTYLNLPQSHKVKESLRGNLVVAELATGGILNLSDSLSEDQIESQDIYGWFLEAASSTTLSEALYQLEYSIKKINTLVDFKAMSFEKREYIWRNFINNGKKPTSSDIDLFQVYFDEMPSKQEMKAQAFFKSLNDDFPKLK